MSTVQVNTLYTIVTEIEQAGREQKLKETARKSWLEQQAETLKGWAESPSAEIPEETPAHSGVANEKPSSNDDPLDFLLFDDTSKYFKQLLRE